MSKPAVVTIHIDGGSRGNPGPAAYGYVIKADGLPVIEEAACIGRTTNNVAEYTALIRALEHASRLGAAQVQVYSDSELLVRQMNGRYQVKNEQLRGLFDQAQRLRSQFERVTITHVRRELNTRADQLCNKALDGSRSSATPATTPAPKKRTARGRSGRVLAAREKALACLRAAADAWAHGQTASPSAEEVWDQLWSILEEEEVVRVKAAP